MKQLGSCFFEESSLKNILGLNSNGTFKARKFTPCKPQLSIIKPSNIYIKNSSSSQAVKCHEQIFQEYVGGQSWYQPDIAVAKGTYLCTLCMYVCMGGDGLLEICRMVTQYDFGKSLSKLWARGICSERDAKLVRILRS